MNIKTVPDAEAQVADDRARLIAGLREFADFLKANPWAPVTRTSGYLANANFQVDLHGPGPLGADADLDTVDRVRQIADWLGVKTSESSDRTDASIQIGSVSYSVIAWHKSGRPDERDTELARLRARNAELESQLSGLAYSREHHEADDPRPVSPARGGQPHVVAMTDDGLVDETPADPVTVYFSFGHGQHDPDSGEHLLGKYVTIVGPSYDACREAMFASKYGDRWAFEYPDDGPATAEWIPRWTEHERIVLDATPVSEPR
jgi:hypothetical protein